MRVDANRNTRDDSEMPSRWASAVLLVVVSCSAETSEREEAPDALAEQISDLYQRARESGEDVSGDVYEWARRDVERIGDWEYRIVRQTGRDDAALEARLNELGSKRWQLVWIEREGGELRLFLKRPTRSYLRHVPLSELPRLIPGLGE